MSVPKDRLYSQDHLWVRVEQSAVRIGLTEFAAAELGEADYVDLPSPGASVMLDDPFATVETSKAVTDLIAPVSGNVLEVNRDLSRDPHTLTEDPYNSGWMTILTLSRPQELDLLLKPQDYESLMAQVDGDY